LLAQLLLSSVLQQLLICIPAGAASWLLAQRTSFDQSTLFLLVCCIQCVHHVQVHVDSPDRFLVEIQFSNGANCDPTNEQSVMQGAPHTLPTQPRQLLTPVPGVSLHGFQELVRKYARGKNTPSNYQLQVGAVRFNQKHEMSSVFRRPGMPWWQVGFI
jgi:hypothetical protein